MGICEYSGDKNIVYSTKSLMDKAPGSKTTNFYFSTEPLSKIDGECLLILSKDYASIKGNKFIKSIRDKSISSKLSSQCQKQQNIQKQRQKQNQNLGEFILFNSYIPGFEFNKFAVIGLSEKEYQQSNKGELQAKDLLQSKLKKNIEELLGQGVRNLVITQFEWKSLLSKLSIFKSLCQIIIQTHGFKSVVFACINEESQLLYMKTVQQLRQQNQK